MHAPLRMTTRDGGDDDRDAGLDEFDVLLNDVLRTVANPELPERVRVQVQTRVWVREMDAQPKLVRPRWCLRRRCFRSG